MPKGVVKTKRDEAAWKRAKSLTHKQYPNLSEDDDSFWKVVQTIYGNMTKATQHVKKELMVKAAEIVSMYGNVSKNKDLVLDTYFMLYHHLAALNRAVKLEKARKLQGRMKLHGLDISIENKKGSVRRGTDSNGHEWKTKMKCPYGYIRLTEGADGEHVDCYVGPNAKSTKVFVVHQVNPYKKTRPYDEDKVMLGFDDAVSAKKAYVEHYDRPDFFGSMDELDIDTFKDKVKRKKGKVK